MASVARRLTLEHKASQARLARASVAEMVSIWRLLDGARLDATFPRWLTAAIPVVANNRDRSVELASAYLSALRLVEVGDAGDVIPAGDMDEKALASSLLVTGPVSVKQAMRRGVPLARAMQVAQASSAASASRHVLDAGRETVLRTTANDDRAAGWQRVASANSCNFCASLDGKFHRADTADFPAHDGCSCSQEPVYR